MKNRDKDGIENPKMQVRKLRISPRRTTAPFPPAFDGGLQAVVCTVFVPVQA